VGVFTCWCCYVWVCVRVGVCTCGCCYVWVLLCLGVCMCGYSDNCVGVLVICVLVFPVFCIVCTVFLYCFVYVHFFLVVTIIRTTATK